MPVNYASPQPEHRAVHCSRCSDTHRQTVAVSVDDLLHDLSDLDARIKHLTAERDEARAERDELGAVLDEVADHIFSGLYDDERYGGRARTTIGALHAAERAIHDQAPATYREQLEHYRTGGALS